MNCSRQPFSIVCLTFLGLYTLRKFIMTVKSAYFESRFALVHVLLP